MKASFNITVVAPKTTLPGGLFSKFTAACLLVAMAQLLIATSVSATLIDLNTNITGTATNGTIYTRDSTKGTGTGVFDPFLRIQNSPDEEGYNADYGSQPQAPYDEKVGVHTHALQFSDLVYVELDGIGYYEFLLDLFEPQGGGKEFIYLNNVQIFNSGASPLTAPFSTNLALLGPQLYNMDSSDDVTVKLNADLASGNGQHDMAMFILASNFANVGASDYITFYSAFGGTRNTEGASEGSFEEWGLREKTLKVSESNSIALLLLGLLSLFAIRRREHNALAHL